MLGLLHCAKIIDIPKICRVGCAIMHNENWNDLRYVLAVGRAGSLNAAARDLGVNHATVLRRIRAFEDRCKRQIFHKTQSGYILDSNINDILDVIQDMEESAARIKRILASEATELSGLVRLTSTDSICQYVLPDIIRDLQVEHPGIQIELNATNQRLNMFLPEADLTIRPTLDEPKDLRARKAGVMRFEIFATKAFWGENLGSSFEELRWLGVSKALSQSPVGVWMDENLPLGTIKFRADSFLVLRSLAMNGNGACILPSFLVREGDPLVRNPKMDLTLKTNVWVAGHEDLERNPHITTCARFLTAALSKVMAE
jgi:DNA-binding transcriptional LysR family regulator